jgi:hypothetical protein
MMRVMSREPGPEPVHCAVGVGPVVPLPTCPWPEQEAAGLANGRHVLALYDAQTVVVYQAFRREIADHAVAHQRFGGPFSLNRMSWIKPEFLWMMHRCGWATKPDQERVLAVRLPRTVFDAVLAAAVPSGYDPARYPTRQVWRDAVRASDVRVQWDPDHDPFGRPLPRRAIQLGLRGPTLTAYARDWPVEILDITGFVTTQHAVLHEQGAGALRTPAETIYPWQAPDAT